MCGWIVREIGELGKDCVLHIDGEDEKKLGEMRN
jgi:hypothetical protein